MAIAVTGVDTSHKTSIVGVAALGALALGSSAASMLLASSKKPSLGAEPRVYGTFGTNSSSGILSPKKSYYYSEFEKKRDDGTFVIDLVPEMRVFLYGGEVTKDVISASISYQTNGPSTCTIQLSNPRGKYEITRQDMMGNWREDKDINPAYTYDWLKRPNIPNPSLLNVAKAAGGNMYKQTMDVVNSFLPGMKPPPTNIPRMVFETKFASGFTKNIGDIVFDYRDPIYIFMKGRFSTFWYFAFSGMISGYDSSDTYGQAQVITITGTDMLGMLQKKKVTKRGSLLAAGNLDTSVVNESKSQSTELTGDPLGAGYVNSIVKMILYGSDYARLVDNCFPLAILARNNGNITTDNFNSQYKDYLDKLSDFDFNNKPGYMFTYDDSGIQDTGLSLKGVTDFFTNPSGSSKVPGYTYPSDNFSIVLLIIQMKVNSLLGYLFTSNIMR